MQQGDEPNPWAPPHADAPPHAEPPPHADAPPFTEPPPAAPEPPVPGPPPHQGQPHAEQPPAGPPYAWPPHAGEPYASEPHAGQPYAGQPYAGPPYAGVPPYPRPLPQPGSGVPGWVVVTFVTLAGLCAAAGTAATQAAAWFVEQVLLTLEIDFPAATWPVICLACALLAASLLVPAAIFVRRPKLRAVAQTWAVAAGCLAVLGLLRAIPTGRAEYAALATALVAAALAATIWLVTRRRAGSSGLAVLPALAVGLVLLLPWWWLGSFGSTYDTAFGVAAAGGVGVLGAVLLDRLLWPTFAREPMGFWAHTTVAGLAAGAALALLMAGAGASGTQLGLLLTVPPTGFALAALAHPDGLRWPAGALIVMLAAVGPLVFVDPEE